jgi:hypothetical protein
MVSGGTRFTRSERPRPAPPVIDVEARPRHETLYDVLVVSPTASTREIRRIARALRRNLPDPSALHDVCLAEQVLGRADLRAEYDALIARLEAAKQPMPRIGVAIEGARLGPAFATRVGRASLTAGKIFKAIFRVAVVIVVIVVVIAGLGSVGSKSNGEKYKIPELKIPELKIPELKIPELKPIAIPHLDPKLFQIEPYQYKMPRIQTPRIAIPKLDPPRLELPKYEAKAPRYELPTPPESERVVE